MGYVWSATNVNLSIFYYTVPQIVAVQKWNELSGTKMLASNVHPQYTKPYILNLNDSVNKSTREIKMHLLKKPSHFRLVLVF